MIYEGDKLREAGRRKQEGQLEIRKVRVCGVQGALC